MELEQLIAVDSTSILINNEKCQNITNDSNFGSCLNIKNVSQRRREHYNSRLLDAARDGNAEKCKRLIEQGKADVNARCRMSGATPIIVATAWSHVDVVEELIIIGADVLRSDFKSRTAVHIAAANGFLAILKVFVQGHQGEDKQQLNAIANARVEHRKDEQKGQSLDSWVHKHEDLLPPQIPELHDGSTPLHAASQWSRSTCVKFLLANGADPSLLDVRGLTALDVAGEKQVVHQTSTSRTPNRSRTTSGCLGISTRALSFPTKAISSRSDSPLSDVDGSDAEGDGKQQLKIFHGIEFDDNQESAEDYLSHQQTNYETTEDVIQLLFEKSKRSTENVRLMSNDNVKIRPRRGDITKPVTCLHTAVSSGNIDLLRSILLKNDNLEENLYVFDKDGLTPLHRAVIMRRLDIIITILEYGLLHLININDFGGRTLLYLAVEKEWTDGVDYFLNNGAELSLSTPDNSNVLHVAARLGNSDLLSELVHFDRGITLVNSMNNNHQTPLWCAVKKSSTACVNLLLEAGAEVTSLQPNQRSLLHLAAENSSPESLRLLLDYGGKSLILKKFEGMTPLQLACRKGLVECVKVLVEYGGKVTAKTGAVGDFTSGGTCLHLAARYGHLRVVEYLVLLDKILLGIPNDDNWYPLHVATRFGKADCAQFMIEHGADLAIQVVDRAGNKYGGIDLVASFIPQPQLFLLKILDNSIETNGLPGNHTFCQVKLKYNVLIPSDKEKRQLKVLTSITNIGQLFEKTLLHPLIESFLFLKWQRLKLFYMVVLMLYFIFTVSFTALSVAMLGGFRNGQSLSLNTSNNTSNDGLIGFQNYFGRTFYDLFQSETAVMLYKSTAIASLLLICPKEIYQAMTFRQHYFLDFESWLKAAIMVLSIWTFLQGSDWSTQTSSSVTAVVVLCSWSQLLFLLARLPNWGFSILMFYRVAQNVLKVLVTFSCLLIGFSYAFMILFQSSQPFPTFWLSLLKIMVMMSEFDYGDMFNGRDQDYLARTVFLAFLILISIVMMNLMVGIAVSDIALLEDQGRVSRLVKQIDFLYLLEVLVYNDLFLKVMPKKAGKALKKMRSAPTEFTFRPGKTLKNRFASFPRNLHLSLIDKADELNRTTAQSLNLESSPASPLSACDEKTNIQLKALQSIVKELNKLKEDLCLLKEQKNQKNP